jgi:hypothetical protein
MHSARLSKHIYSLIDVIALGAPPHLPFDGTSIRLPQKSAQFAREIYAICGSVAGTVLELAGEPLLRSSPDGQSWRELLSVLPIELVFSGIFHEPVEPSIRF